MVRSTLVALCITSSGCIVRPIAKDEADVDAPKQTIQQKADYDAYIAALEGDCDIDVFEAGEVEESWSCGGKVADFSHILTAEQIARIKSVALTKWEVNAVVRQNSSAFNRCTRSVKTRVEPTLVPTRLVFVIRIAPDGSVKSVNVDANETCLANVARTLRFPRPRGGGIEVRFFLRRVSH